MAYFSGYHNGPRCVICGYYFCVHCNPGGPETDCSGTDWHGDAAFRTIYTDGDGETGAVYIMAKTLDAAKQDAAGRGWRRWEINEDDDDDGNWE